MMNQVNKPKLNTILEMDSLAEFVQMAEMSQKKFEGLRGADAVIVNTNEIIASGANDRAGVMNKFLN
jgi:deoxycytidylate deaminase